MFQKFQCLGLKPFGQLKHGHFGVRSVIHLDLDRERIAVADQFDPDDLELGETVIQRIKQIGNGGGGDEKRSVFSRDGNAGNGAVFADDKPDDDSSNALFMGKFCL